MPALRLRCPLGTVACPGLHAARAVFGGLATRESLFFEKEQVNFGRHTRISPSYLWCILNGHSSRVTLRAPFPRHTHGTATLWTVAFKTALERLNLIPSVRVGPRSTRLCPHVGTASAPRSPAVAGQAGGSRAGIPTSLVAV